MRFDDVCRGKFPCLKYDDFMSFFTIIFFISLLKKPESSQKTAFTFDWWKMSSPLLINVNNVNGRGCTLLSIRKGCLGGRGALPTIEKGYPISIISYILSWKSAQLRLTPWHSIIGIYILFTLLFTFPLVLTRRICLSIKAS